MLFIRNEFYRLCRDQVVFVPVLVPLLVFRFIAFAHVDVVFIDALLDDFAFSNQLAFSMLLIVLEAAFVEVPF